MGYDYNYIELFLKFSNSDIDTLVFEFFTRDMD